LRNAKARERRFQKKKLETQNQAVAQELSQELPQELPQEMTIAGMAVAPSAPVRATREDDERTVGRMLRARNAETVKETIFEAGIHTLTRTEPITPANRIAKRQPARKTTTTTTRKKKAAKSKPQWVRPREASQRCHSLAYF
jgi:hypothetical protein